jgi:hypothetical protein
MIMEHPTKKGQIVCPYHGSQEIRKGLEKKQKRCRHQIIIYCYENCDDC